MGWFDLEDDIPKPEAPNMGNIPQPEDNPEEPNEN
jgi:hypothetical protein